MISINKPVNVEAKMRTMVNHLPAATSQMINQRASAAVAATNRMKVAVEWDRVDARVKKIRATWVKNAN